MLEFIDPWFVEQIESDFSTNFKLKLTDVLEYKKPFRQHEFIDCASIKGLF
jgi:hypothetical protein